MTTPQRELRATLKRRFARHRSQLLPALHYLQEEFGHLPGWAMEVVAWHLGVPASEVYGSATSYTELRIQRPGNHVLRVCTGLSCWLAGGQEIMEAAGVMAPAAPEATSSEQAITLEETVCGFLCALSPAVEMDGVWRGRSTVDSVRTLIAGVLDQ